MLTYLGAIPPESFLVSLVFSCFVERLPVTYMGLPLKVGRLKKAQWRSVIDKIQKMLEEWKGKLLSFNGRLFLIFPFLLGYARMGRKGNRWVAGKIPLEKSSKRRQGVVPF